MPQRKGRRRSHSWLKEEEEARRGLTASAVLLLIPLVCSPKTASLPPPQPPVRSVSQTRLSKLRTSFSAIAVAVASPPTRREEITSYTSDPSGESSSFAVSASPASNLLPSAPTASSPSPTLNTASPAPAVPAKFISDAAILSTDPSILGASIQDRSPASIAVRFLNVAEGALSRRAGSVGGRWKRSQALWRKRLMQPLGLGRTVSR